VGSSPIASTKNFLMRSQVSDGNSAGRFVAAKSPARYLARWRCRDPLEPTDVRRRYPSTFLAGRMALVVLVSKSVSMGLSRVTVSAGLASTPLILSSLDRDHRNLDLFRCGGSTALRWRVGPVRNRQFGHLVGAKRPSGVLLGGRTTRRPCRIPLDRRGGGWRSHPRSWPWQCHGSPFTARTRRRRSSGPRDDRPHEVDWKALCTPVLP
jgi:hypothetical protein